MFVCACRHRCTTCDINIPSNDMHWVKVPGHHDRECQPPCPLRGGRTAARQRTPRRIAARILATRSTPNAVQRRHTVAEYRRAAPWRVRGCLWRVRRLPAVVGHSTAIAGSRPAVSQRAGRRHTTGLIRQTNSPIQQTQSSSCAYAPLPHSLLSRSVSLNPMASDICPSYMFY